MNPKACRLFVETLSRGFDPVSDATLSARSYIVPISFLYRSYIFI